MKGWRLVLVIVLTGVALAFAIWWLLGLTVVVQ